MARRLLLVEDNPADVRLVRSTLARTGRGTVVDHVADGEAALAFLRRNPPYESAARPDLVLLDLNLPRVDGRELLVRIRSERVLDVLPVIVMSTSASEEDVDFAYRKGANSFIVKRMDLDDFASVVRSLEEFWMAWACLPGRPQQ